MRLAIWGWFAEQIGLAEALEAVPLGQKTYQHTPQTKAKVIEFVVTMLGGRLSQRCRLLHPALTLQMALARALLVVSGIGETC